MRNLAIDILLVGVGFAAGAYFMHVRMRKEYERYAEAQIADVQEHYKMRKEQLDKMIDDAAQKKRSICSRARIVR